MSSPILFPALAAALLCCGTPSAMAQPAHTTKYVYYTIAGDSAAKVYNAMIKRGPHVNGAKAYASTAATSSQQGKLAQGKSCEIQDYRLKMDFVIRLPKISNPKALQCTLEMINAETQLLFASDWPHFDFDLPSEITDLPFLSEQAKRNILGLNAARIFNLDPTPVKQL